jgi:hypothetical protein
LGYGDLQILLQVFFVVYGGHWAGSTLSVLDSTKISSILVAADLLLVCYGSGFFVRGKLPSMAANFLGVCAKNS